MHPNIEKVLIDEKTLKTRIAEMAAEISKDYEGEELLVIGLLKGASYFMMELTQHLSVPTQIDFLKVSSRVRDVHVGEGRHPVRYVPEPCWKKRPHR